MGIQASLCATSLSVSPTGSSKSDSRGWRRFVTRATIAPTTALTDPNRYSP